MAQCKCGKRMSKWASRCKECHNEAMVKSAREYVRVEALGRCPECNNVLVRNNSLADTYWLQCHGFGMLRTAGEKECGYQILAGREEVDQVKWDRARNG